MPTYQYACTACGERLEAVQTFTDAPLTECPACSGALRKVFSAVGVVFKGSGFYKNDSREKKTSDNGTKKDSDSGAKKDSDGGTKKETAASSSSSSDSSPSSTPSSTSSTPAAAKPSSAPAASKSA